MIANTTIMHTAYALSLALAVLSALHLYWVFGGTWGLAAALGREQIEPTGILRVAAGSAAIKAIQVRQHIVEGDHVAVFFEEETIYGPLAVFAKFQIESGRIEGARVFYDPRRITGST